MGEKPYSCANLTVAARQSSDAVSLRLACFRWENSRNLCTQSIGIKSQFAMRLAHALSHSPNSDADSLGLNLCQSFLRNSLTVILNLRVDLVGLTSDTDYRSFAS